MLSIETDQKKIEFRLKQIQFGKNTIGYDNYIKAVPRWKRKSSDPQTPNPYALVTKRAFQGICTKWRRMLHKWDTSSSDGLNEKAMDSKESSAFIHPSDNINSADRQPSTKSPIATQNPQPTDSFVAAKEIDNSDNEADINTANGLDNFENDDDDDDDDDDVL